MKRRDFLIGAAGAGVACGLAAAGVETAAAAKEQPMDGKFRKGLILGMLPGMGAMKNVQVDESALSKIEAIILSMTPYERENPGCLNSSRKRRIAAGCGRKVEDVNRLLKQFEQMQALVKQMNGKGKKRKMFGKMGGGFPGFPCM